MPLSNPEFPFQQTMIDFLNLNSRNYRYTGLVDVALMPSGKARVVCNTLRTLFCTYGTPEELSSDGRPTF